MDVLTNMFEHIASRVPPEDAERLYASVLSNDYDSVPVAWRELIKQRKLPTWEDAKKVARQALLENGLTEDDIGYTPPVGSIVHNAYENIHVRRVFSYNGCRILLNRDLMFFFPFFPVGPSANRPYFTWFQPVVTIIDDDDFKPLTFYASVHLRRDGVFFIQYLPEFENLTDEAKVKVILIALGIARLGSYQQTGGDTSTRKIVSGETLRPERLSDVEVSDRIDHDGIGVTKNIKEILPFRRQEPTGPLYPGQSTFEQRRRKVQRAAASLRRKVRQK